MSFYDDWMQGTPVQSPQQPSKSSVWDDWNSATPLPKQPSKSSWDDWIEMGLRTGPSVAGGFLGGVLGAPAGGVGAVPGAMLGGATGSAIGNVLGNWYSGRDFNPVEFGVETLTGAIPPILGPAKLGGQGLKELLKYGASSALRGGLEGAAVNAAITPFQHYAQTGNFDAQGGEYLQNAAAGGLFGGVLGGGMGLGQGAHTNARIDAMSRGPQGPGPLYGPMPPPPKFDPTGQGVLPGMENVDFGGLVPPSQVHIPQSAPQQPTLFGGMPETQPDLPFQYRGDQGRFTQVGNIPPEMRQGQLGESPFTFPEPPTMVDMAPPRPPTEPPAAPRPISRDQKRDALIQAGYSPKDIYLMGDQDLDQVFQSIDPTAFNPQTPTAPPQTPNIPPPNLPPTPPQTPPPSAPPANAAPPANSLGIDPVQDLPGVIFKGDLAVIIQPSQAIGKALEARGYESVGVVDHFPTWKRKENIAETAFSRSQSQGPQTSSEGLVTVGPNDEFVLQKKFATKTTLKDWENEGYKVIEVRENGDVVLGPNPTFDPDTQVARQAFNPDTDIARAKVAGGGLTGSFNVRRGIENLTKDYSSPLPGIMKREGMQNAFDAIKKLIAGGGKDGVIRVRNNETDNTMEIYDNGPGMDEDKLATKLVEVFGTDKEGEAGASGGKGMGSASYIYGGKHFQIETVSIDAADGKKYRIIASGTPDQFLSPKGSDYSRVEVPMKTPTGTEIKVTYKDTESAPHSYSRNMMRRIIERSRGLPGKIFWDRMGYSTGKLADMKADDPNFSEHGIAGVGQLGDKQIGDLTFKNNEIKVNVVKFDPDIPHDMADVHYLNNGMYQFTKHISIDKPSKGFPEHVLVDIHPLVDELHTDYPFTNTREHMKDDIAEFIDKFVEKNIEGPAVEKRKNRTQELYDAMVNIPVSGTRRNPVFYDPGDRMTPAERKKFLNNQATHQLIHHFDGLVNDILDKIGRQDWADKLEGVGLLLDPESNGLHVPNPSTSQSSIGFNPFIRTEYMTPKDAAWHGTITALHEVAHIGSTKGGAINISWNPADLADPRIGKFMQAYANQMTEHGDVSYQSTGHSLDYMQRLLEVFSVYGVDATFKAADKLERIYTGGNISTGGYSPRLQELTQIYSNSRGRPEVTDDLLSRTGVKQSNTGPGGTGNVPGNAQGSGSGATPPGQVIPPGEGPKKPSLLREMYNFARGATTTGDLSAPLRQGLPLIFTKNYWKSLNQMRAALGDEKAFQKTLTDLQNRPLFQKRPDPVTGKPIKSFAEMAGMKLSDLKSLNTREEAIASNWVEKGGFLGSDVPYLNKETGVQRGYQQTLGRGARATNRAYTAFLNQLRADSFEALLKDASADFKAGTKGAKNPYADLAFAKEIADFVNTATGRGPLKLAAPGVTGGRLGEGGKIGLREYSGERFAPFFTDTVFSPRLMASRVRMLNPATYAMASPFVRKQYLKSMFSVVAFAGTVGALAKGMGADVSLDPNSSDFGKIHIGNTRLDMMGGFQQYGVAVSRLMTGHVTSSASGKDMELGQGYRAPTRGDIIQNFMANKSHPIVKFAYDMVNASTHQPFQVGDRTLQLFVPLIIGDVLEIAKQDPKMLPMIAPVVFGAGTQTYEKGASMSKFIPKEYDPWNFTGGSAFR